MPFARLFPEWKEAVVMYESIDPNRMNLLQRKEGQALRLLGTIVNAAWIIVGSILGLFLSGIPERLKTTVLHGVGLTVFVIGASMGMKVGDDNSYW
jgi:hypothetical protein